MYQLRDREEVDLLRPVAWGTCSHWCGLEIHQRLDGVEVQPLQSVGKAERQRGVKGGSMIVYGLLWLLSNTLLFSSPSLPLPTTKTK